MIPTHQPLPDLLISDANEPVIVAVEPPQNLSKDSPLKWVERQIGAGVSDRVREAAEGSSAGIGAMIRLPAFLRHAPARTRGWRVSKRRKRGRETC